MAELIYWLTSHGWNVDFKAMDLCRTYMLEIYKYVGGKRVHNYIQFTDELLTCTHMSKDEVYSSLLKDQRSHANSFDTNEAKFLKTLTE